MSNLQYRQDLIKAKRMKTPWRDFVMEICSWSPVSFYKNDGKVSVFPESNRIKIKSNSDYQSYRDELCNKQYSLESEDFFLSMGNLLMQVGMPNVISFFHNENCDYVSPSVGSKNCYLSFGVVGGCENVFYSYSIKDGSKDVLDSVMVRDNCSIVYNSAAVFSSFKVFSSKNIFNSQEIYFSTNLQGCSECIGCDNLTNASYCVKNVPYEKEEYLEKKQGFLKQIYALSPNIANLGSKSVVNSAAVINCEDVENGIFCYQVRKGRNVGMAGSALGNEDLHDTFFFGSPSGNRVYGLVAGGSGVEECYCSYLINGGSFIFYSIYLENCSFCLGCIGLRNKEFCIFNKQYEKDERYAKVDEIFGKMNEDGVLGDFFPGSINPFYFNDTAAYLIDQSFTKEEVTAKGYLRRDEPVKVDIPADAEVVKSIDLDQLESTDLEGNRTISADIMKKVIQDENGNYYRIIPMEYKFLVKYGLPLPRKHRLERMKENFRIS